MQKTILITGASGFIGGWLAESLFAAPDVHVRAGIRSWARAARLSRFPIDIVHCDVLDQKQINAAADGVSAIIHCAAGPRDTIVHGTENVLAAARRQNVERFIHLSTVSVYGDTAGNVDEEAPFQYTGDEYGDAKIEAEKRCNEYGNEGLPTVILRPSAVYGPFSTIWVANIARQLYSANWQRLKGHGDGTCNIVYIADLVESVVLALHRDNAVGQAFNINGTDDLTWNDYYQLFNAALGLPELSEADPVSSKFRATLMEPVRRLAKFSLHHLDTPIKALYQRSHHMRSLMKHFETSIKTTPSLAELSLYNRQCHYSCQKARRLLGFEPRVDAATGLALAAAWVQHLGIK